MTYLLLHLNSHLRIRKIKKKNKTVTHSKYLRQSIPHMQTKKWALIVNCKHIIDDVSEKEKKVLPFAKVTHKWPVISRVRCLCFAWSQWHNCGAAVRCSALTAGPRQMQPHTLGLLVLQKTVAIYRFIIYFATGLCALGSRLLFHYRLKCQSDCLLLWIIEEPLQDTRMKDDRSCTEWSRSINW